MNIARRLISSVSVEYYWIQQLIDGGGLNTSVPLPVAYACNINSEMLFPVLADRCYCHNMLSVVCLSSVCDASVL